MKFFLKQFLIHMSRMVEELPHCRSSFKWSQIRERNNNLLSYRVEELSKKKLLHFALIEPQGFSVGKGFFVQIVFFKARSFLNRV